MTHIRPGRAARGAFTLTELLVVILILLVLISLTAAGVMRVFYEGPKVKVSSEIRQLEVAVQQFYLEFPNVNYIPSYIILREDNAYNPANPAEVNTVNYLRRLFGKNINLTPVSAGGSGIDWNGNGVIDPSGNNPFVLEGRHCLVFFLGGIPSPPGTPNGCLGFSTNPTNPALPGGTRRGGGPFYTQFEASRLIRDTNTFFYYADAWTPKIGQPPQPYAYFSAYGVAGGYKNSWGLLDQTFRGLPKLGDNPTLLWQMPPMTPSVNLALSPYTGAGGFANNSTFQIISAGKDNQFGTGGNWRSVVAPPPFQGAWELGKDNQTNFARGVLDAEQ